MIRAITPLKMQCDPASAGTGRIVDDPLVHTEESDVNARVEHHPVHASQAVLPRSRRSMAEGIEAKIATAYEKCHPGDTFADLKARERFSKEDRGLLAGWRDAFASDGF